MDHDARTIPELLLRQAERIGDRLAIVDEDAALTLSFAALRDAALEAARAFVAIGVQPGDRVAVWAPNGWQWVVAALGAQSAGAVLVPINTRFKGAEAAFILQKSRAHALVTAGEFRGVNYPSLLEEHRGALPDLRAIVTLGGAGPRTVAWPEFLSRGGAITVAEIHARIAALTGGDLADVLFTSGTTGRPKGAMCTHEQDLRCFRTWCEVVGLSEGDRYLIVNPYFHSFGYKAGWLACLLAGATNYPQAVFDVAEALARVERNRITVLPGPPTLYQTILNDPGRGRFDLSSLRVAITGAAAIPVELIRRMREELKIDTVLTAYGLTECCGVATMCAKEDDAETIATTSGRAIPGTEVRIVGDGGPVAPGEPGEVLVRGFHVMKGYLDDDAETARAIDGDGWLHTGDVGVMDARGNLRITDRIKDMFIVGGFNAYPAEIENTLLAHEQIAQVAIIGVPDERLGEVGMAFVVPRVGTTPDPDEIVGWARARMANYKVPRKVVIVEGLPLNATGKVVKYRLRELAKESG